MFKMFSILTKDHIIKTLTGEKKIRQALIKPALSIHSEGGKQMYENLLMLS